MDLHEKYGLTRVINAAGTFTPLGVSRSSPEVGRTTAAALSDFFVIDDLQEAVSRAIARLTGAEAGAVTHCVAAGITLSVAAFMGGNDAEAVSALPNAGKLKNRVVLPAGHAVDYGHPIVQDIRLAGAVPILAGEADGSSLEQLDEALRHPDTAGLLLVSSRLVTGRPVDLTEAVEAAHRRGLPAVIDGAAQDLRMRDLLASGADLLLVSGHKYLASPTAGLVIGRRMWVDAVRAHEKGIGRAMKPTKEAIIGVLAALEEREHLDSDDWRRMQDEKVARVAAQAAAMNGLAPRIVPDPAGMPFSRIHLQVDSERTGRNAADLAAALKSGDPSIRIMEHGLARGELILELVPLRDAEIDLILTRLAALVSR